MCLKDASEMTVDFFLVPQDGHLLIGFMSWCFCQTLTPQLSGERKGPNHSRTLKLCEVLNALIQGSIRGATQSLVRALKPENCKMLGMVFGFYSCQLTICSDHVR